MSDRRRRGFDRAITRLLLLSGIPLLVYGLLALWFYRTEIAPLVVQQVLAELQTENSADSAIIEAWLSEQQSVLRYFASRPETRRLEDSSMLAEARQLVASFPNLDAIVVARESGEVIMDSHAGTGGNISDRSYFREAILGRSVVSDVIVARTSGRPMVLFAEPIRARSGSVIGVVFAPVRPTVLDAVLGGDGGEGIVSFVIDSGGSIVTGGNTVKGVGPEALPGNRSGETYRSHRGLPVYGVSTPVTGAAWRVVSEVSTASVSEGFGRYNRALALGAVLAVGLAALAAVLLGLTIEVPIRKLEASARKLGAEGLAGPDRPSRIGWAPRELRELQNSLVQMARQIEERQEALEKSKESLREALAEKTVLLREVNHRVRNNLAVVKGILSLERSALQEGSREYGVLLDVESRVTSMALIHDQLYQSPSVAQISLKEYLNELLKRIRESHGRPDVELRSSVESIVLEADRGIPCGIIVNELVINAYKHAFPGRGGFVDVAVRQTAGDTVELSVLDDGVGQSWGPVRHAGIGRDLLEELTRQLEGTVEYRSGNGDGTEVTVRFPA